MTGRVRGRPDSITVMDTTGQDRDGRRLAATAFVVMTVAFALGWLVLAAVSARGMHWAIAVVWTVLAIGAILNRLRATRS